MHFRLISNSRDNKCLSLSPDQSQWRTLFHYYLVTIAYKVVQQLENYTQTRRQQIISIRLSQLRCYDLEVSKLMQMNKTFDSAIQK